MPGKRGNGEGSVRQRPNGLWEARIQIDGQSHSVYGKTRAAASKKLTALLADNDKGVLPVVGHVTVRQYFERWIRDVKPQLEPSSYRRYRITRGTSSPGWGGTTSRSSPPSRSSRSTRPSWRA